MTNTTTSSSPDEQTTKAAEMAAEIYVSTIRYIIHALNEHNDRLAAYYRLLSREGA